MHVTCDRCGATSAKALEWAGISVAYFSAIPAIAYRMGVSRIIPGKAAARLLGDPVMSGDHELILRRRLLLAGLRTLTTAVDLPPSFQFN